MGNLKQSCSGRQLFKGTNPICSEAWQGEKGKDRALNLTLFFLLGSLGPHKLRLCHAENCLRAYIGGYVKKLRKASKIEEVGSSLRW